MVYLVYLLVLIFIVLGFLFGVSVGGSAYTAGTRSGT